MFQERDERTASFPDARRVLLMACHVLVSICGAQVWPETRIAAPMGITANGRFGSSLSMDGDWLLVGAPGTNDGAPGSGAAYLYNRYESGQDAWGLVKKLEPPSHAGGAAFGSAVFLDGGRAYITAPGEPWLVLPVGAVHVFEQDMGGSGNWGHKQRIVPDSVQPGLAFGTAIAVDHDLLLVNAPGYDESMADGLPGLGAVIGFVRDSSSVFHEARFARGDALVDVVNARPCVGDRFAIFDGRVTHAGYFGAFSVPLPPFSVPYGPFGPVVDQGLPSGPGIPDVPVYFARGVGDQVHLLLGIRNFSARAPRLVSYTPDGNGGLQQDGIIHPPDTMVSLTWWHWGDAIDMEDPFVAVGAYGDETFTPLGRTDVYRKDPGQPFGWTHHTTLFPSQQNTGDQFGRSVAISNGNVVVGTPGFGADDVGTVFVFRDPTVGMRTVPVPGAALVYPDPIDQGTRFLHLVPGGLTGPMSVRITTEEGRIVIEQRLQASRVIELPPMAPGTYVVQLRPMDERLPARAARFIVLP